jgi:hypothetical protein
VTEEVEKVNPDLVNRDCDGKLETVRYDAVNATFLKEFLKERRKVEEQGAMIAQQQEQIEALTAALQKMNAQLEPTRPRTPASRPRCQIHQPCSIKKERGPNRARAPASMKDSPSMGLAPLPKGSPDCTLDRSKRKVRTYFVTDLLRANWWTLGEPKLHDSITPVSLNSKKGGRGYLPSFAKTRF